MSKSSFRRYPLLAAMALAHLGWAGSITPAAAQSVKGRVLDDGSRPVPEVLLELIGIDGEVLLTRVSNQDGLFRFPQLPPGSFRLRAERLGFRETISDFLSLRDGEELEVELRMAVEAVLMDPLTVTASPRPWYEHMKPPALWEFYERREHLEPLGRGRFMDQEDLGPLAGMPVTMAVATVPGMQAMQSDYRPGRFHLVGRRGCDVLFFLNGMQVRLRKPFSRGDTARASFVAEPEDLDWFLDDFVSLNEVEAIEVYRGASELPGEFHGMQGNGNCGAVVVWTKRGVEPIRRRPEDQL